MTRPSDNWGRVSGADPALAVPAEPVSRLGPSGFDRGEGFTPGPWRAFQMEKHALKGFVIDTDFGNSADNGYVIADHIFGEQAEANARLIAAAPDMFEALQQARQAITDAARDTLWCDEKCPAETVVDRIDDALAKVRGEA